MKNRGSRLALALLFLTAWWLPAKAGAQRQGDLEVGLYGGAHFPDDYGLYQLRNRALIGARLGYFLLHAWSAEINYQHVFSSTWDGYSAPLNSLRLNGLYNFYPHPQFIPFLTLGVGLEQSGLPGLFSRYSAGFNAGGGCRWLFTDRIGLRADVRYVLLRVGDPVFEYAHNVEVSGGLFFLIPTVYASPGSKDSDGDGISDTFDLCPNTHLGMKVDSNGCPLKTDSDGDGVTDDLDQCPNTPRGTAVDGQGCPLKKDSDGDVVIDALDQCPNTPPGTAVDDQGCPLKSAVRGILKGVHFETGSAIITADSYPVLNRAAAELKIFSSISLQIEGHTDNTGRPLANQRLSEQRAVAVMNYLAAAGVPRTLLVAKGFGQTRPIADNSTPQGRYQNRRVELKWLD